MAEEMYKVIIDREERYTIWPADREAPFDPSTGWRDEGKVGTKEECLAYIEEVWTDKRPKSLRDKMDEMERKRNAE